VADPTSTTDGSMNPAVATITRGLDTQRPITEARIIHEGQGLRSADVREGGAWGAIGGVG